MRVPAVVLTTMLFLLISAEKPLFENLSVIKTVDMTEAIVNVTIRYQVSPSQDDLVDYQVAIPNSDIEHMAYIETSALRKASLSLKKDELQPIEGVTLYTVHSSDKISNKFVFFVNYYLTHVFVPVPATITQQETPKYVFNHDLYVQSPYPSQKQEIRFNLPASTIFSYTDLSPNSKNGNTLTYGPFASLSPFVSPVSVRIHFPSVAKFRTLETVEREIEISHWGNVAIEEVIRARNSGSPLTGEFSRLDYYKSDPDSVPYWEELTARIDRRAMDVYYRDILGNITTSHVRRQPGSMLVELQMRFPMLGGWKNEFYWGYNLPSNRVLKKEGEHFSLTVPFSTPIEQVDVQELTVRVILPECVKNVEFSLPEGVEAMPVQKRFTYLDSSFRGRPVYEFKKRNLIELQKGETITVTYDLNQMMLWREPLMCIGAFAGLFFLKAVIHWLTWRNNDKVKRD
ncbi:uncharacterized protein [Blastocystis hominis]|uniref:Dolichyl-diphosphooligosaccharide--protein glycosyltransferase subunit 1 n=1 Tax=Blastocystis hominis TaxID=12968 RepID=D8LXU8_BLAHO|nr:uncharacterized protein [Blastocystis hominis]CBK20403.2 unnamed protein product [Blastocystis hominis]|eukprot:XP_012894451.1 uncharacterized protein [Blastocystis hominis]